MPKQKLTAIRDGVLTMLGGGARTMQQVADDFGVSIRTVRRWKNEGVQPRFAETRKRVIHRVANERVNIRRAEARLEKPVPHIKMPIQLQGMRRELINAVTGKRFLSSNVTYNVIGLSVSDIVRVIASLRNSHKFQRYRFIVTGREDRGEGEEPGEIITFMSDEFGGFNKQFWGYSNTQIRASIMSVLLREYLFGARIQFVIMIP